MLTRPGRVFDSEFGGNAEPFGGALCLGGSLPREPLQVASGRDALQGVLTLTLTPADLTSFGSAPRDGFEP